MQCSTQAGNAEYNVSWPQRPSSGKNVAKKAICIYSTLHNLLNMLAPIQVVFGVNNGLIPTQRRLSG